MEEEPIQHPARLANPPPPETIAGYVSARVSLVPPKEGSPVVLVHVVAVVVVDAVVPVDLVLVLVHVVVVVVVDAVVPVDLVLVHVGLVVVDAVVHVHVLLVFVVSLMLWLLVSVSSSP